ncbi:1,5-rhamnosyltransferase [Pseudomonas sp. F-14 TE3623]
MRVFFLGWKARYEQIMIDGLAENHNVHKLHIPAYAKRINRTIRSLQKKTPLTISTSWLGRLVNANKSISSKDILICNEGQAKRGLNPSVIKTFKGVKVLLIRDLVDAPFVDEMRKIFDRIYSFDPVQCRLFGIDYLEQFFPFNAEAARKLNTNKREPSRSITCFFLGRDKGRSQLIEEIANDLESLGCSIKFQIVKDESSIPLTKYHTDSVLSYEENLQQVIDADVLIEINQPGQSGLTLRTLEAAFFDKKLITTNKAVKDLYFYDPSRFYIFEEFDKEAISQFLASPSKPIDVEALKKHCPETMLKRIRELQGSSRCN